MTYFLNSVEEEPCLRINCEGEMRTNDIVALHHQLTAVLARSVRRLLLDVTSVKYSSTGLELFFYFGSSASASVPRSARIALVLRPDQVNFATFFETLLRHGGALFTCFVDSNEAEAWVKSGSYTVSRSYTATASRTLEPFNSGTFYTQHSAVQCRAGNYPLEI